MSNLLNKITQNSLSTASVSCNLELDQINEIKKNIPSPHGASLVALTAIDPKYPNLQLNISFDYALDLNRFSGSLLEIWGKYKPIPSNIRSCKQDGKFVENYDDQKLLLTSDRPQTIDEFEGRQVLIDIELTDNKYIFKLSKWTESNPRIVICELPETPNVELEDLLSGKS